MDDLISNNREFLIIDNFISLGLGTNQDPATLGGGPKGGGACEGHRTTNRDGAGRCSQGIRKWQAKA